MKRIITQEINDDIKEIITKTYMNQDKAFFLVIRFLNQTQIYFTLVDDVTIYISGSIKNIKFNSNPFTNNLKIQGKTQIKLTNLSFKNDIVIFGELNYENHTKLLSKISLKEHNDDTLLIPKQVKSTQVQTYFNVKFNSNYQYRKIPSNPKKLQKKHILLSKEYQYILKEAVNKYDESMKCVFCCHPGSPSDSKQKLHGKFQCIICMKWGCFWHFTANFWCIKCAAIKYNWYNIEYNELVKHFGDGNIKWLSYYFEKGNFFAVAKVQNQINIVTNIIAQVYAKILKNNGERKKGYLKINCQIKRVSNPQVIEISKESPKTLEILNNIKAEYDKQYNKADDKTNTDIYLKYYLLNIPTTRYKKVYAKEDQYILSKKTELINGEANYGNNLRTNAISIQMRDRALIWSKYIKHCITRDHKIVDKGGNETGYFQTPNLTIIKKHEHGLENYFRYYSSNKIALCNQKIFKNQRLMYYNDTLYSKIFLGNYYHTFDMSSTSNERKTGIGLAKNGGFDINKFHHFNQFAEELFKIGTSNIAFFEQNSIKKYQLNSIQINSSTRSLKHSIWAPQWHWDVKGIYQTGILTIHMTGHNAFLTNSDMFNGITSVNLLKDGKKRESLAKKIFQYGLVKSPCSLYYINGVSVNSVDHCILNNYGLSIVAKEYNEYIKKKLTVNQFKHFKIKPSPQMLFNQGTESWVLRYIPKKQP